MITHFKRFRFPKLPLNNLKLLKIKKVNVSHHFKSEGQKKKFILFWWLILKSRQTFGTLKKILTNKLEQKEYN